MKIQSLDDMANAVAVLYDKVENNEVDIYKAAVLVSIADKYFKLKYSSLMNNDSPQRLLRST